MKKCSPTFYPAARIARVLDKGKKVFVSLIPGINGAGSILGRILAHRMKKCSPTFYSEDRIARVLDKGTKVFVSLIPGINGAGLIPGRILTQRIRKILTNALEA